MCASTRDLSASCIGGRADLFDLYDTAVQAIRRSACVRRSRDSHGFLPFLVRSESSEIGFLVNISHGSVNSRSGWLEGSAVQEAQDVVGDRLGLLEASLPRPPFPVLGVEDAVMRLNPASTDLVEIRSK